MLLRQQSSAIKNQLVAKIPPTRVVSCSSLVLYGIRIVGFHALKGPIIGANENAGYISILTFEGNITEFTMIEVERPPVIIKSISLTICYDHIHELRKGKISIFNYKTCMFAKLFKFVSISRDQSTADWSTSMSKLIRGRREVTSSV